MNAEIISVGTEILMGQITNTNARYLSEKLASLGVDVYFQTTVGDNFERLKQALSIAFSRSNMVILTGGLGPTGDDITKEAAASYFDMPLYLNDEALAAIEKYFQKLNRKMTKNNEKQAMFPKEAIILPNDNGTAPGCIMEKGDKAAILLPGPPIEMVPMFEKYVIPYLKEKSRDVIYSKVLRFIGIGEAALEERLSDLLESQTNPTLALYAKEGEVTVRVSAKAKDENEAKKLVEDMCGVLISRCPDEFYAYGDDNSLVKVVCKALMERNLSISTAESCTGGLLGQNITSIPGASQIFSQGIITYSNSAKMQYLGVREKTLKTHGAVSCECAKEMAQGMRRISNSDISVAITGIAGPSGGTAEKPVGLVYISLAHKNGVCVKKFNFSGSREKIRNYAVLNALNLVREYLNGTLDKQGEKL